MRLRCRDTTVRVSNVETSGLGTQQKVPSVPCSWHRDLQDMGLTRGGPRSWELRHGGAWAQVLHTENPGLQMPL